jgi:hypothetical protein
LECIRPNLNKRSITKLALITVLFLVSSILVFPLSTSKAFTGITLASTAPKITLGALNSSPGKTVKVTGVNFTPTSAITVSFAGGQITTTTSDSSGGFVASFVVPLGIPAGLYPVQATDAKGLTAEKTLTIALLEKIAVSTSGASHIVGVTVVVSGSGFPSNAQVNVMFGTLPETTSTTDSQGSFTTSFSVPQVPNGIYTIQAIDGTNIASKAFAIVAHLTVSPTGPVTVGTMIAVSGTGFSAGSQVTFTFGSSKIATKATTLADGTFSVKITVPNLTKGGYALVATDQNSNSAQIRVQVSN